MNSGMRIRHFILLCMILVNARAAPPANDLFGAPTLLTSFLPLTVNGTCAEATAEFNEPDYTTEIGITSPLATVWYQWTCLSSGLVEIRTEGTNDTVLGVFTGVSIASKVAVAINDDGPTGVVSRVRFAAVAGTTYRFMVDAYSEEDQGPFVLTVRIVTPPANDAYVNRTVIHAFNLPVTGSNVDATAEATEPNVLGEPAVSSVWYKWTSSVAQRVEVVATNSAFSVRLAAHSGADIAAAKTAAGLGRIRFTTDAATTEYKISVDGRQGEDGPVSLVVRPAPAAPANDAYKANPTGLDLLPLTANASTSGSTVGASQNLSEPAHDNSSPWASVWFYWQAPVTQRMEIDTFGSSFDTVLAVYSGGANTPITSLIPVASNNDTGGLQSRVRFNAGAGTIYRIAVDSPSRQEGAVLLNIRPAPVAPVNDAFNAATVITTLPATLLGSNAGASAQVDEPVHNLADFVARSSVWYRWTAPVSGWMQLDTSGSSLDAVIAVYTGTQVTNLTEVALSHDGDQPLSGVLEFHATAGQTYRIAIEGESGLENIFQLVLRNAPPLGGFALATNSLSDQLRLSWPTRPGRLYQVWSGPLPDQLTPHGEDVEADGNIMEFDVFPGDFGERAFFQVRAVDPTP
jgi:hypothetical protein